MFSVRRFFAVFACAALLGVSIFAITASPVVHQQSVAAWSQPGFTAVYDCDGNVITTVNLANEGQNANYDYQLAWGPVGLTKQSDLNALNWTTYTGAQGNNQQTIAAGTGVLYVRWVADYNSWNSATPSAASNCTAPPDPPVITPVCMTTLQSDHSADDPGYTEYNWYIVLPGVANDYNMDYSTNGTDWVGPDDWSDQNDPIAGGGWGGPMTTTSYPNFGIDGHELWVRWSAYSSVVIGPVVNPYPVTAAGRSCGTPTPPAPPVVKCGGTVSFSNVPDGWKLIIEPDVLVTSGFDSISLAPGDYTYQWRDADNNDISATNGSGIFTVGTCPTSPPPPSKPVVKCGGTVSFSNVPDGWKLIIEPDVLVTSGFDSISLAPGDYTYQWRDADNNDMVGGTFTIGVCPTPTPTPAPTCVVSVRADTVVQVTPAPCATPVVTPTPKSTSTPVASTSVKPKKTPATTSIAGGSDESDSNSIPLFPLFICLILGGIGVGVTLMVQRRAAH